LTLVLVVVSQADQFLAEFNQGEVQMNKGNDPL